MKNFAHGFKIGKGKKLTPVFITKGDRHELKSTKTGNYKLHFKGDRSNREAGL